ncbi:Copper chaperone CopZ [Plantibacter sp. VKM Ac-1784]|uniref:Copper chaperone CopZ n=1 Tax=Plantibacter elymi (nom. nud.) TaxID=199708 RepID=A0ABY1RGD7_9MICO|nr:cation transporter [Plantibacter sp. VKM Ac-1784]SMQ71201.1 Copper chaperone CopZ [Plantibacter sp. VKM Ac-1784]
MPTITESFRVSGMTCEHCVASVTQELTELETFDSVRVTLEEGLVTVTSAQPIDEEMIRQAIEAVGYDFGGRTNS